MGSRWKVCVRGRGCSGSSTQARCETEGPHAGEHTVFICFSHVSKIFAGHKDRDEIGRAETWNPTTTMYSRREDDD